MQALFSPVSRAFGVPLKTRARRAALWVVVALAFVATVAAQGWFALEAVAPSFRTAVWLDIGAVVALVLTYALLATSERMEPTDPIRALWVTLLSVVGFLTLQSVAVFLIPTEVSGTTLLPTSVTTMAVMSVIGGLEGLVAIIVLIGLRPLVLYRRRVGTVAAWRLMLMVALFAALASAGQTAPGGDHVIVKVLDAAGILIGLTLALRQSWVVELSTRRRIIAAVLSVALSAALMGILYVRVMGPTLAGLKDPEVMALGALFSQPVDNLFMHAAAFGMLFSLTAGLVLIFQLPSADGAAQRAGERRALRLLADSTTKVLDRDELAAAIAEGPVEARLADSAWLATIDIENGTLEPRVVASAGITMDAAQRSANLKDLLLATAGDSGPLVLPRAEMDHRVTVRPGDGIGSLIVFPLLAGGRERGVLMTARRATAAFESDDISALTTFAAQASVALSHAEMIKETVERDRIAGELQLAREVQQRLFPQTLPSIEHVEIARAEEPAREMGGDYYDVVALAPDCVGVIVADVAGKGAAAAFYMAELKGIFQSASRLTRSPGEFLARANEALTPSLGRGVFVSAVYSVLDAAAGTLSLARAGHPPAVLSRNPSRADGGRWLLKGGGVAIGLDRGPMFRRTLCEQTIQLAPGDVVLLYTDGLTEVRNPAGEEFGYERLADAVHEFRNGSADEIRDRLLERYRSWSEGSEPTDDVALVVLRWTGSESIPVFESGDGAPPLTERPAFPTLP